MIVKYTGTADGYTLDAADFKKAQLDQKKTRFPSDEGVEVPDEVGKALTAKDGVFGDIPFEQIEEPKASSTDSTSSASTNRTSSSRS